jgi:translation initiation factor IF-2
MSLRIHELAKRINMEGKELLTLLKTRGWIAADTKSVSSTVSKIYIEEIEKEFAAKSAGPAAAPEAPAAVAAAPAVEAKAAPSRVALPAGVFAANSFSISSM